MGVTMIYRITPFTGAYVRSDHTTRTSTVSRADYLNDFGHERQPARALEATTAACIQTCFPQW